jgi:hypothetical protein
MKDSVEPRTHQKHDVGILQCQGARRRDRQGVIIRHDTLAHRRTQERDLRALEKGAHLVLGARPSHALADEDEWPETSLLYSSAMAYEISLAPDALENMRVDCSADFVKSSMNWLE